MDALAFLYVLEIAGCGEKDKNVEKVQIQNCGYVW